MIEATAIAVKSAGVPEIAAGSTRDSILLLRSVKPLVEQVDQPRFLLSLSLEGARTFLKRVRLPELSVLVLTGRQCKIQLSSLCTEFRVAKAYR